MRRCRNQDTGGAAETTAASDLCLKFARKWNPKGGAPIPPHASRLGKISTEPRSTHGTFFFLARYCGGQKVDPT
jgi:hypothetical protein